MDKEWYRCPILISKNAEVKGIEYKCKRCKEIIDINIEPLSLSDK